MTAPVTVIGGADGITAHFEDLVAYVRFLQSGAIAVGEARDRLAAPAVRWSLDIGPRRDAAAAEQLRSALAALVGEIAAIANRIQSLAGLLLSGIWSYQRADDSLVGEIIHTIGEIAVGAAGVFSAHYSIGAYAMYSALPAVTDLAMLPLSPLERPFSEVVPDGHPVLHDMGTDARVGAETPPHALTDLIAGLALRNAGRAGEISVSFVVGGDGRRRAIVDIPGTKSWNPIPNHNVTSVGTDIRALDGRDTAYEDGIFLALDAAGADQHDDVMLVGHSEGGIVAINAARAATESGRFRITHVVTAGSPIGRIAGRLPDKVQVLALENSADVVPHFDGAANPDRPNVTTVTVSDQHDDFGANHDLAATYEPAAADAQYSCNVSVNMFLAGARGFLDGATMRTHVYRITRGF